MGLQSSIKVNLEAGGVAEVARAFKTVGEAAEQAAKRTTDSIKASTQARVASQRTAQSAHIAERNRMTELTRARIAAQRSAQAADIAMMKVGKESSVGWLRGWVTSMDSMKAKSLEATSAVKKAMKDLNSQTTLDGLRAGIKNVTAETDKLTKSLRGAKSAGSGSWQISSSIGKVGRAGAGAAMRIGGMAATLGGGYGVADAVQKVISAENAGVALANSMYNPNDDEQKKFLKGKRFDQSKILALSGKAQHASGVGKAEFLSGVSSYIAKSSDWKSVATEGGQKTLIDLARLSKATGSDFGEVMNAAGSLRVQNENLTPEKMMEMMYGIVGQSKMGAVEMKDLAQHAAVVTSSSGSFGVGKGGYRDQAQAQAALLGLSQIAIQTSGSPAEAATAVKSFAADLNSKGVKAEGRFAGLKLRDENHKLLKASTLVENIFAATKGDSSLMGEGKGHIGLGRESIRIMQALNPTYDQAYQEAKASGKTEAQARAAASKATGDKVRKFESATYSKDDADTDLKEVLNTKGERFNKAMTMLMDVTERRVAPFIEKLAQALEANEPKIEKFIGGLASVADELVKHPLAGLGAAFGAAVALEVAKAKIGDIFASALRGGGGGGGMGAMGGSGMLAGGVVAAVAANLYMTKQAFDTGAAGYQEGKDNVSAGLKAYQTGDRAGIDKIGKEMRAAADWDNDPTDKSRMLLALPAYTMSKASHALFGTKDYAEDDIKRGWKNMGTLSGSDDTEALAQYMKTAKGSVTAAAGSSSFEAVGGIKNQWGKILDGDVAFDDHTTGANLGDKKQTAAEAAAEAAAENAATTKRSIVAMEQLTGAIETATNALPNAVPAKTKFGRNGDPIGAQGHGSIK